jgi:ATP-dependent Clp protease protease subunit
MMIHDPGVVVLLAYLSIEDLRLLSNDLKAIKDGIVPVYATRTGLSEDRISRMMADETWMSARQAVDYGFADQVLEGGQKGNISNVAFVNALRNYVNVPLALMQAITRGHVLPEANSAAQAPALRSDTPQADDSDPVDRDLREAQILRNRVQQILKKEIPHA